MSIYIKKVKSNLKQETDVELGQKTLIVGKNGSGKSSILNSIELCLAGYVSDFRGKTVKKPNDLITLTDSDELKIQCVMSNGKKSSLVIKRKQDGTVSRPKALGKTKLNLPMLEITNVLEGSAKNFKSWILERIDININDQDLEAIFKETGASSSLINTDRLVETIGSQLTLAKEKVSNLQSSIRSRKITIDEFAQTIDKNVDLSAPAQYSKAKNQLADYERKDAMMNYYMQEIQGLMKKSNELTDRRTVIKGKLDTINMHPSLLPTKEEIIGHNIRKDVVDMLGLHQSLDQTHQCLVCGGKLDLVEEKIAALNNSAMDVQNKVDLLKMKVELEQELIKLNNAITDVVNQLNKIKYDQDQLASKMVTIERDEYDFLKIKIEKLSKKNSAVTVYKLKMKEIERVKEEYEVMQDDLKDAKRLVVALEKIQTEFVWEAKDRFTDKIEEFLSYRIELQLDDKSVLLGKLAGPNKVQVGLSGAEYMELKFALAQAMFPTDSVLLAEDRAIDEDRLLSMMKKFSTFYGQVILTSVFKPSTIPQDWTLIEL